MNLPIEKAAIELGTKPGTLRRYCKQGMPHQPGGKGRGKAVMVDPAVARHWITAPPDARQVLSIAGDLPSVLATAIFECWQQAEGVNKQRLAGVLAAGWYLAATAVLDRMREHNSAVPDISSLPAEIQYLQKIARGV
ncbi:MAG: hypothetical protein NVV73_10085 [Cellvibrionaceae bacterium]|nr:hypothetical protein [Cellvibrionaceae bacterium]